MLNIVRVCVCLCVSVCGLCFTRPASAQISEEELRRERVETTEEMRRTENLTAAAMRARKDNRGWLYDYGYTLASSYTSSTDNDRDAKSVDDPDHTWDHDVNLFGLVTSVDRRSKFYMRAKTAWTDPAKIGAGTKDNDVDGPKIDMFYVERKFQGERLNSTLTFGRQFSKVGRGIAYGLTADGILWNLKGKKIDGTILFMRQNPGDNNLDNLAPGSGRTKRWFFGTEYKHKFKKWMSLNAYMLWNIDQNNEQPSAVAGVAGSIQRYQYDSQFYGLGTDGTMFSKLNYWWEYIRVTGKTYDAARNGSLTAQKVGVDGEAFDLGGRWLFGGDLAPTVFAEYAFGSGDADRVSSNVTSSQKGSTHGKDSVFRSFGGLTLGHALAPSLSNIRVAKLGASAKPFGRMGSARWSDMTLNLTMYNYWAYAKGGATSDPAISTGSTPKSNDIGSEYDMTASWKVFNDVNYQLKWGVFRPGAAYVTKRGSETYVKMKVSFDL